MSKVILACFVLSACSPEAVQGWKQVGDGLQGMADGQPSAQERQKQKVMAANPAYGACLYYGQCGAYTQPQQTTTTCGRLFNGQVQCQTRPY